jgi:hypothetical protein
MYQVDNWLDEALYPDFRRGRVPSDVWTWEFLRRNASFRSDFDALIRPIWQELSQAKHVTGYYDEWKHESAIEAWIAMPTRRVELPLIEKIPPISENVALAPRHIYRFARWKRWQISVNDAKVPLVGLPETRSKFSKELGSYESPTKFIGPKRHFIFCHSGYSVPGLQVELDKSELNRVAWVKLDLQRTIESQIDAIAVWARDLQRTLIRDNWVKLPKVKKPRIEFLATYLRILDAAEAGASYKEIARVLFPEVNNEYPEHKGSRKVENALPTAKKLRDQSWNDLLDI